MTRHLSRPILGVLGGRVLAQASHAADMEILPATDGKLTLIMVEGEMALTDGNKFAAIVAGLGQRPAAYVLNSPGGALLAGLQMGQIIRLHRLSTYVPQKMYCASACAIAWLSGEPRIMQQGARIGFHAAYVNDGVHRVETGVGNALVGAYMTNLGLSVDAIVYVETAHPNEITWLTEADARKLGISMKVVPADNASVESL